MRTLLLVLWLAVAGVAQDSPWFLGMEGGVYRGLERVGGIYRVGEGTTLERLGLGLGQEIAVSALGEVSIVGLDNGVYVWQEGNWNRLGTGLARLVAWPR